MSPEMKNTLEVLCKEINKKYGANSVIKLTEPPKFDPENVIPTGSIALDTALGIGGYPKGRIIEIYGQPSAGKSSLCLHAVANAQKQGKSCVYLDVEQSLDPFYAQQLGVSLEDLYICQPDFGEQALDIADDFIRSGEIGLIIVDSVAALVPKKELEGEVGDQVIGLQARLMSQSMRKFAPICNKTGTTIIFVNQIRNKIGGYGNPNTTSGGLALPFYASIRLEIARTGDYKSGSDGVIGNITKVKVVKNKMAAPKKEAEFNILFGKGIDGEIELVDLAVMDKILDKSGPGWYKYEGNNVAQGLANCTIWLNENPEIKEKIRLEVLSNRGME